MSCALPLDVGDMAARLLASRRLAALAGSEAMVLAPMRSRALISAGKSLNCAMPGCDRRPQFGLALCPLCQQAQREGFSVLRNGRTDRQEAARTQLRAQSQPMPDVEERPAADRAGWAAAGGPGGRILAAPGEDVPGAELSQGEDVEDLDDDLFEAEEDVEGVEETAGDEESVPPECAGAETEQIISAAPTRRTFRHAASHARVFRAALTGRMEAVPLGTAQVSDDAEFFLAAVKHKIMTEAQVLDVISVPERIEAVLQEFAARNPIDGRTILTALRFRKRVLAEFERLLAAAAASASPEAERAPGGVPCAAAAGSTEGPGLAGDVVEGAAVQTTAAGCAP